MTGGETELICIYESKAASFQGHGLGVLHPTACEITEEAGGGYELAMTLPMAQRGGDRLAALERVIRAPGAPKREAAREQLFRIYEMTEDEEGLSVTLRARHITYDLTYNAVQGIVYEEAVPAIQAAKAILGAMADPGHGFTCEGTCETPIRGDWRMAGGINAFLDQEAGVVRMARARLVRDNHRLVLLPEGAPESGVSIRYGSNMTGFARTRRCDQVYTRFIPVGENENGEEVRLPEGHVDSPHLSLYAHPRISLWQVPGARVGSKQDGQTLTLEDVYAMLREAAQEKLRGMADRAAEDMEAGYIDLRETEEHAGQAGAQKLCLYDRVTIRRGAGTEAIRTAVSGYTYDCLRGRYTRLTLGDVYADKTAHVVVTAPQAAKDRRENRHQLIARDGRLDLMADTISMQAKTIEAQAEQIRLKAESTVVDGALTRITAAEIRLDGLAGQILLKADQTTVNGALSRISAAEVAIDGANAQITLKASQTTVDALGSRVSAAEIAIDGANSRIDLKADKITLQGYVTATALETRLATIDNLLAGVSTIQLVRAAKVQTDSLSVGGRGVYARSLMVVRGVEPVVTTKNITYKNSKGENQTESVVVAVKLDVTKDDMNYWGL